MTAIPLSAEDEAAAQLIVGRVEALKAEIKRLRAARKPMGVVKAEIERLRAAAEPMVPASVVRRQLAAVGQDMIAMQKKIDSLRAALEPLALVAKRIDGRSVVLRPDDATIWQAMTMKRSPFDLTMGNARAARKAMEEEA